MLEDDGFASRVTFHLDLLSRGPCKSQRVGSTVNREPDGILVSEHFPGNVGIIEAFVEFARSDHRWAEHAHQKSAHQHQKRSGNSQRVTSLSVNSVNWGSQSMQKGCFWDRANCRRACVVNFQQIMAIHRMSDFSRILGVKSLCSFFVDANNKRYSLGRKNRPNLTPDRVFTGPMKVSRS